MPTYTYRCQECGHEFDARQRMSDDPLIVCPVCEGDLRRVVGKVGIVFKGSGFYVTDHRGSNGKGRVQPSDGEKPASDSEKPAKEAASKVDSKSDSEKPKAKSRPESNND